MIELETLKLEKINYKNIEHLNFLKQLMKSTDIYYLWDLSKENLEVNEEKNNYIVCNKNNEKIGFLNISLPTEAYFGNTVSIYYAVEEKYRGKNYGKKIIEETNKWLIEKNNIDCIIAQVEITNIHSQNAVTKAGMKQINITDDYITYFERKK